MTTPQTIFDAPGDKNNLENGTTFTPKFGSNGLITAVVTDADDGEILMLAHMNDAALHKTITSGEAWFWSRSRKQLWLKGETSGNVLEVIEMRTDCDQDAIILKVRMRGDKVACHTGARSCFYRIIVEENGQFVLKR